MNPPSPRGLGRDAGSVTLMSFFAADDIVRAAYANGEIRLKEVRGVYRQDSLAVLSSLGTVVSLLSMP
jgi:hypothetical protein